MRELDRLNCWRDALAQLHSGPSPNEKIGADLRWFWITYGFHVAESLKGDLILIDLFKRHHPPYAGGAVALYRGELAERHHRHIYGFAWTPNRTVAQMFASRRQSLGEGNSVVLQLIASPEMIVAVPTQHSSYLGEDEYLVDPRLIGEPRVIV